LRIGHCGRRAKRPGQHWLLIKQLNRVSGGTCADMRLVIKHSLAHVAYKRLDGPEGNAPFNHVSDKGMAQGSGDGTKGDL